MGDCQFYSTPTAEEAAQFGVNDPDIVLDCGNPQGDGPLFFFVPVPGGAVRVPVCAMHGERLAYLYGPEGGAEAWRQIGDLLALAPFYDHRAAVRTRIGGGPGVEDMVLYALDGAGLIEHGGGIGGSWLTAKGRHYLSLMRRYEWEDIEDEETGVPHDGEPCETVRCRHWQASQEAAAHDG
jgi:hypothetical protein